MESDNSSSKNIVQGSYHFTVIRILFLAALAITELLLISVNFDSYTDQYINNEQGLLFLAYLGRVPSIVLVFLAALFLLIWPRRFAYLSLLQHTHSKLKFCFLLILQIIAFLVFYIFTIGIFGIENNNITNFEILGWFISLLLLSLFWLFCFASKALWAEFIFKEKKALILSLSLGLLALFATQYLKLLLGPLSSLTFDSSALLLSLIYPDVFVDADLKLLGTSNFVVNIAAPCSGYEGIVLILIFTSLYLHLFKQEFCFPQALLLYPIGILTIWVFNIFRIVLLIVIGSSYSEEIAVGGFHSQAGWISFLLVSFGLLVLAHKLSFFSKQTFQKTTTQNESADLPTALLLPFIALMIGIIISAAFSASFVWLYPIRVVLVVAVLAKVWKTYALKVPSLKAEPVIAGIFVFIFWIFLVPNDESLNQNFHTELFSAPTTISFSWLIFRFIGAVITIPIVEELLFRGYLFGRLTKQSISLNTTLQFSWKGLIFSSVLFGVLHSNIIAGFLAGLVYGIVRYRSNSIVDSIIAHSVTNLLLSLMVIYTLSWSMW